MLRNSEILSQTYIVRRRLAVEDFMVCPLCEAVNVKTNYECFVCRWAGEFNENPALIETQLYDMIYHCPELLAILIEEEHIDQPSGFWGRFRKLFSWFRRKVDIRV